MKLHRASKVKAVLAAGRVLFVLLPQTFPKHRQLSPTTSSYWVETRTRQVLPVAPRSPAPLDTVLCGPGFLKPYLSMKKGLPIPRVHPQPWEGVKAQDGLGPLLVAKDVTSGYSLFQSPPLKNKEINTQLERFNLLTRPRGAVGIIKCHAKVNYSSTWHGA